MGNGDQSAGRFAKHLMTANPFSLFGLHDVRSFDMLWCNRKTRTGKTEPVAQQQKNDPALWFLKSSQSALHSSLALRQNRWGCHRWWVF
ncbi:hypothetical protein RD1_1690 [Roseobacter denitrificans OCh 114]|uniref:Uncharacterized protein n=1 Tax=Roseobacter denitrificans (strain ATCC 33942 / OCh 114) TaxID=375451 RepID=Q169M9_ROSDO|nr:hypothetical protein RD1_1690 [Roseobacter denitrificans OCh 114]